MGFSLSWLATKGKAPEGILVELGLRATGEDAEAGESAAAGANTSKGWYLVVLDGAEHRLLRKDVIERLSQNCEVLTCTVEEHVMFSEASGWRNGREEWRVTHRGEDGPVGLEVQGTPPAQFAAIRDDLSAQQEAEGGADAGVDYLFDIPVVLVQSFTGFKHDEGGVDGDELAFELLEATQAAPSGKSWFQRLVGR